MGSVHTCLYGLYSVSQGWTTSEGAGRPGGGPSTAAGRRRGHSWSLRRTVLSRETFSYLQFYGLIKGGVGMVVY